MQNVLNKTYISFEKIKSTKCEMRCVASKIKKNSQNLKKTTAYF